MAHKEIVVKCAGCGHSYCGVCSKICPHCGSPHIIEKFECKAE